MKVILLSSSFLLLPLLWPLQQSAMADVIESEIEAKNADLDGKIQRFIQVFALRPLNPPPAAQKREKLYFLGRKLFFDKNLSGNKNISCATCHHPSLGTGDGLPLSLGEGRAVNGTGIPGNLQNLQHEGKVIQRNSPPLYNLSEFDRERPLFWDGRVRYNRRLNRYETPLDLDLDKEATILASPEYQQILAAISSPLAMQAMFPLLSNEEMLGDEDENALAKLKNPLAVWKGLVERILGEDSYTKLLQEAYPNVSLPQINMGHLASAIAHFITYGFQATETPYDRYLRGDKSALSTEEKRGLMVFLGTGSCIQCHNGPHLSDFAFINVGIPILERRDQKPWNDFGRSNVTLNTYQDLHKFKTAALRNVALTAPYMHNGAFKSLKRVIEHYNDPIKSLSQYEYADVDEASYSETFIVNRDVQLLQSLQAVDLRVSGQLDLTEQEKRDLEIFLKKSLTQDSN